MVKNYQLVSRQTKKCSMNETTATVVQQNISLKQTLRHMEINRL